MWSCSTEEEEEEEENGGGRRRFVIRSTFARGCCLRRCLIER
jgi:hypothetical protein